MLSIHHPHRHGTEVMIKLALALPTTVVVVQFPDVQTAIEVVADGGIRTQCTELCDDKFMHATHNFGVINP